MNMYAMFRYRVVLTIFLIGFGLCSGVLLAQNISVKSFRLLETDLTANMAGTMKRDQNNEVSALIKVVTTETGFAFDGGMLGIVGAEQRTGEIWVYVPQKSRKITLSHQKLGVLRDYYYPVPVEAGRTYEMVLTTGKVTTIVQESAGGQYLVMTVTPANAEVSIDDVPVEVADGVVSTLLKYGKHTYRVSAALHEPTMGQFEIGNAKKELSVALQPAYGILQIDSDPAGAEVYIDGDYQPAGTTPFTSKWLSSGKHTLQFKMPVYKTRTMEVAVPGNGATQSVEAVLQPNFAEVAVSAPGDAEIYINNELKGVGRWSGRLNAGLYTVEARKASHYSSSQSVEVEAGDKRTVTLSAPTPRYGSLNVNTRPVGATVSVDGTALTGTTPNIYADILIGEHTLTVAKSGYAEAEQRITVEEGKVLPVSITLTEKEKVAPAPSARTADLQSETKNRVFTVNGVSFKMVYVEGGAFEMGATPEQEVHIPYNNPPHRVSIDSYYIGETEVSQALWTVVMGKNPSSEKGDKLPVNRVSWKDCQSFIKKLNRLTGKNFRLPTEAEWEYAARGGKMSRGYKYAGSNKIGEVAWRVYLTEEIKLHDVAMKMPNELGIYDMTGNLREWCGDWYDIDYYDYSPQNNPVGPTTGDSRVLRDNHWDLGDGLSLRSSFPPNVTSASIGLRLALPQDKEVLNNNVRSEEYLQGVGSDISEENSDDEVYIIVEQMPVFPGGQTALAQYIASHLKYPTVAQENGIQGRVFVSFVVGEDGYVEDVRVIKGVEPMLDKEAVRVIQSLPRWTPGNQQGKPVRVKYTVPVTFALQ